MNCDTANREPCGCTCAQKCSAQVFTSTTTLCCVSQEDLLRYVCLTDVQRKWAHLDWRAGTFRPANRDVVKLEVDFQSEKNPPRFPFPAEAKHQRCVRQNRSGSLRVGTQQAQAHITEVRLSFPSRKYVIKERRTNTLLMDLSRFFRYLYCTWVFSTLLTFAPCICTQISVLCLSYTGKNTLVTNIKSYYWSISPLGFCSLQRKIPI